MAIELGGRNRLEVRILFDSQLRPGATVLGRQDAVTCVTYLLAELVLHCLAEDLLPHDLRDEGRHACVSGSGTAKRESAVPKYQK